MNHNDHTFKGQLDAYNSRIQEYIKASEIPHVTSTITSRCTHTEYLDEPIKAYLADKLTIVSEEGYFTLVKNDYPPRINAMYGLWGLRHDSRWHTYSVVQLSVRNPTTSAYETRTYLDDNLKEADMTWDNQGVLLTPVIHKWEHRIINLKFVNAWIKANIQDLVDMRTNAKKLGLVLTRVKYTSKPQGYASDIAAYISDTATEAQLQRLIDCEGFKEVVAEYLAPQFPETYIKTFFDTYEELEHYKSNRLGKKS
jgi:hypothetical protein